MPKRRPFNDDNASTASSTSSLRRRAKKKQKKFVLEHPDDDFLVKAMTSNKTPKISNCGDKMDFPKSQRLPPRSSRANVSKAKRRVVSRKRLPPSCKTKPPQVGESTTATASQPQKQVVSVPTPLPSKQGKKKRRVLGDLPLDHDAHAGERQTTGNAEEEREQGMQVSRESMQSTQQAKEQNILVELPVNQGSGLETVEEGQEEPRVVISKPEKVLNSSVSPPVAPVVDNMDCSSDDGSLEIDTTESTALCTQEDSPSFQREQLQSEVPLQNQQSPDWQEPPETPVLLKKLRKSDVDNPEGLAAMFASRPEASPSPSSHSPPTPMGTTIGGNDIGTCASLDGSELTMLTLDKCTIDEENDDNEEPASPPMDLSRHSPHLDCGIPQSISTPARNQFRCDDNEDDCEPASSPRDLSRQSPNLDCDRHQFRCPEDTNITSATKSARQAMLSILEAPRQSHLKASSLIGNDDDVGSGSDTESCDTVEEPHHAKEEFFSPLSQAGSQSKRNRVWRGPSNDDDEATIIQLEEPPVTSAAKLIFFEYEGQLIPHPPLPSGWDIHVSKSKNRLFYTHPDHGSSWHCPVVTPLGELSQVQHPSMSLVNSTLTEGTVAQTDSDATATDESVSVVYEKKSRDRVQPLTTSHRDDETDFSMSTVDGEIQSVGNMRRVVTMEHADPALALTGDSDDDMEFLSPLAKKSGRVEEESCGAFQETTQSGIKSLVDIQDDDEESSIEEEIATLTQRNAGGMEPQTLSLFPSQRVGSPSDILQLVNGISTGEDAVVSANAAVSTGGVPSTHQTEEEKSSDVVMSANAAESACGVTTTHRTKEEEEEEKSITAIAQVVTEESADTETVVTDGNSIQSQSPASDNDKDESLAASFQEEVADGDDEFPLADDVDEEQNHQFVVSHAAASQSTTGLVVDVEQDVDDEQIDEFVVSHAAALRSSGLVVDIEKDSSYDQGLGEKPAASSRKFGAAKRRSLDSLLEILVDDGQHQNDESSEEEELVGAVLEQKFANVEHGAVSRISSEFPHGVINDKDGDNSVDEIAVNDASDKMVDIPSHTSPSDDFPVDDEEQQSVQSLDEEDSVPAAKQIASSDESSESEDEEEERDLFASPRHHHHPDQVDMHSVESVSTLGRDKRSISTETLLSKFSVRILSPPHPVCSLQHLDKLMLMETNVRGGRFQKRAYGTSELMKLKGARKNHGKRLW